MHAMLRLALTIVSVASVSTHAQACRVPPRHDQTLAKSFAQKEYQTVALAIVTQTSGPAARERWGFDWVTQARIDETIYGNPMSGAIELAEPTIHSECFLNSNMPAEPGDIVVLYLKQDRAVRFAIPRNYAIAFDPKVATHLAAAIERSD